MDGLTMLSEARAAGLIVMADGDRLVIRGPRSADTIARRLLANKAVVMAALAAVCGPDDGRAGSLQDDDGGRFADWVRRPDSRGRMGWQAPETPVMVPFDDLPRPGPPCPKCGSLELWQSVAGTWRCCHCDAAALQRSRELADLAARLRKQAQPSKPAPRIAPVALRAARSIFWTYRTSGPSRGIYRGLAGRENGQALSAEDCNLLRDNQGY